MTPQLALQSALSRPTEALVELNRLEAEESLLVFLERGWRYIDPRPFVSGWHLEAIAEHLEAVTDGEIRRLVINVPPRMTKSSLVSVAWPAWTWAQRATQSPLSGPGVPFLFTSYAQTLSERDSVKTRRLIQSPWYQNLWGGRFTLTDDQNQKRRFENDAGGYRLATSVTGTLTGEGGMVLVCDDPHNVMEIESEAQRNSTIMWWDEAFSSRLNDLATGAYVIIMQRLYENDLTGHVLTKEDGWTHLMLPMEYEPKRHCTTPLGFSDPRTTEGELLSPARVPQAELEILKIRLGPFGTAGQLQQAPVPRGGGILKSDWWQAWPPHVEELEDNVGRKLKAIAYPPMEFVLASLDTAMTEKEENDWSALTVWGIWYDKRNMPQIMLMEAWEERLAFHTLVSKTIATCTKRQVDRLLIEAKNNGFSVAQEVVRLCRQQDWGTQLEPVKGDKVARAHACVPTFAGGQVWAPARNIDGNVTFLGWAQKVIDQAASFPRGDHDDLVDSSTQAINHMRRAALLQTKDERATWMRRTMAPPGKKEALYGVSG